MSEKNQKWIGMAARRAAAEEWTLGSLLQAYRQFERKDESEVVKDLGCTLEVYRKLAICRRPRPLRFSEDVNRVSERFGLNPNRLAAVIRRAEVLRAVSSPWPGGDHIASTLLAARDRPLNEAQTEGPTKTRRT